MARDGSDRIRAAAAAVLVPGERVLANGTCWAVQLRPRVPLLFLARRRYLLALTDRRLLVFERRRGGPAPTDLVLGKRYDAFTLERVRRRRPLLQLVTRAPNGSRFVFEFRPRERDLGGELVARLSPDAPPAPELAEAAAFWGDK